MNIIGRPAYAQIDLAATYANAALIKKRTAPAKLMAVVKADAYGHGAAAVAKTVLKAGADYLAVATIEEARLLRDEGLSCPLFILGWTAPGQLEQALNLDLILTVFDLENAKLIAAMAQKLNKAAQVHLKLDTGMGRLGFAANAQSLADIESIFGLPKLQIEGLFSHFACAGEDNRQFSSRQLNSFLQFKEDAQKRGLYFPLCHIANSPAILSYPEANLDLVRPGLILHGYSPAGKEDPAWPLKPSMTIKAAISQIRSLNSGDSVSYGRTWRAGHKSRVATLPLGYADGLPRLLSNCGQVLIGGQRAPIIGNVCMDQIIVDISHIEQVSCGDEAVIMGGQGDDYIGIEQIAAQAQTISYEVLSRFGQRLPHIFVD